MWMKLLASKFSSAAYSIVEVCLRLGHQRMNCALCKCRCGVKML